jgi:mannose-6-phosphate isomerase
VLVKGDETLVLNPGESGYLSASESPVTVSGNGRIARVFNILSK